MKRLPSSPLVMTKPKAKLDRLQATLSKLRLDKSLCRERHKGRRQATGFCVMHSDQRLNSSLS